MAGSSFGSQNINGVSWTRMHWRQSGIYIQTNDAPALVYQHTHDVLGQRPQGNTNSSKAPGDNRALVSVEQLAMGLHGSS